MRVLSRTRRIRSEASRRLRWLTRFVLACSAIAWICTFRAPGKPVSSADAQETQPNQQSEQAPITLLKGELGDLLRQWSKEGTAAGNVGDYYDNRDGGHSELDLRPFPQVQKVVYSPEDVAARRNWAAQRRTLPHVVFGNSSTSAPPLGGGSNIRHYYTAPAGLALLYDHYRKHNLYIYPEHRDHDPGHNGRPDGYGDLYPTNTPYLIASQGSSGSDQPFMRAMPTTLAAFRPEVKRRLIDKGLLMPTVQMIFRRTNKHVKSEADYLSGKAHPTVFDGGLVDPLAMAKLAHEIELSTIPPFVHLLVTEEDEPRQGADFFDPVPSEKLCDTPAVIARLFRGKDRQRRMVVSAVSSFDLNNRPLKFRWVVLRGDPTGVVLKPQNESSSLVEVTVDWPVRSPIAEGAALESNRVDIGVFAHNGTYYSAPGIVTFYAFDHEARTYDATGRVLEIGYGHGETRISVTNWGKLLEQLSVQSPASQVLRLNDAQLAEIQAATKEFAILDTKVGNAQADRKSAAESNPDPKTTPDPIAARQAAVQAADKQLQAAIKARSDFLEAKRPGINQSLKEFIERAATTQIDSLDFLSVHHALLSDLKKGAANAQLDALNRAMQRLVDLNLVIAPAEGPLVLKPLKAAGKQLSGPTAFARSQLTRYHAELLCQLVFPGMLQATYLVNVVDFRLTMPKDWRDIYRYDNAGNYLGWTRYSPAGITEFNPDGLAVTKVDSMGRCLAGKPVVYVWPQIDPQVNKWQSGQQVLGTQTFTYEYRGPDDFRGTARQASSTSP